MSRIYLDQTIEKLKTETLVVGQMVSEAATLAVKALLTNDRELAVSVYQNDQKINQRRFSIESDCLMTIATQQPLATDLRVLASILEIVTELERMGDYAKGIAKINLLIDVESTKLASISHLEEMTRITVGMLERALQAFMDEDIETARGLPAEDDAVDDLFNQIYQGLVEAMIEDNQMVALANQLQWAAHNIERMADRVVNICERTIFVVSGVMNELEESDDEWTVNI